MTDDEWDRTTVTEQLPLIRLPPADRTADAGVILGRARPVVLSDGDRVDVWQSDDLTVMRERFQCGHEVPLTTTARRSLGSIVAHGAVVLILATPLIVGVAFAVAFASR